MGVDFYGKLVYGIAISEDVKLPWDKEEFDGDPENWWAVEIHKFKPSVKIWDEHGEWLLGIDTDSPEYKAYFMEWGKEKETHPLPVMVVWCGTYDDPSIIISVEDLEIESYWGEFVKVDTLRISPEYDKTISGFVKKYIPEEKSPPSWYLTGIMG